MHFGISPTAAIAGAGEGGEGGGEGGGGGNGGEKKGKKEEKQDGVEKEVDMKEKEKHEHDPEKALEIEGKAQTKFMKVLAVLLEQPLVGDLDHRRAGWTLPDIAVIFKVSERRGRGIIVALQKKR